MEIILTESQYRKLFEDVSAEVLATEAEKVNLSPTDPQKKAGNYSKGHISIKGMRIAIENPAGSKRKYYDDKGNEKFTTMKNHYGYFNVTKGKDGDAVDVFLGPYLNDFDTVYCVDQSNKEGDFDETKVMLGFKSKESAKKAYLSNYSKGWNRLMGITAVSLPVFKQWLYRGRKQRIPFSQYVLIQRKKLDEVRYITTAKEYYNNPQDFKHKFETTVESLGWGARLVKEKGNTLFYHLTPSTNTNYDVEQFTKSIKAVYKHTCRLTIQTKGNEAYATITLNNNAEFAPIGKNEKIRVFHGMDIQDAIKVAKEGLSGKEKISRAYSYENGMNPNGLFVTIDFNKAKEFGYAYNDVVILEFTANSDDLDTPVWNGQSTYFGQNTNPQPFANRTERIQQKLAYQRDAEMSSDPHVTKSDNPAMANTIFNNNEHQALFFGDITPNMIKHFWVKKRGATNYEPYTLAQFLKEYGNKPYTKYEYGKEKTAPIKTYKLYRPNEEWNGPEDFAERASKNGGDYESYIELAKGWEGMGFGNKPVDISTQHLMKQVLFPKQIIGILGEERYRKYFDRLYPEFREKGKRV